MNDLQRILDMLVRMNAHDAGKVRDMAVGRLRELEEDEEDNRLRVPWSGECPPQPHYHYHPNPRLKPMTADEYREATERPSHIPGEEVCDTCHGEVGHRINCPEGIAFSNRAAPIQRREGAELQAGLEEAVRRDQDTS
jgi:hypothetical protein